MMQNYEDMNYGFSLKDGISNEAFIDFKETYKTVKSRRLNRWSKIDINNITKSRKMKRFIRKGIPYDYRSKVWLRLAKVEERMANSSTSYEEYVIMPINENDRKVINADIPRTFPDNPYFQKNIYNDLKSHDNNHNYYGVGNTKYKSLERLLVAFAAKNEHIGYCQGLNFIGAIILLVIEKEEHAFWLMDFLINDILQNYYGAGMEPLQIDCMVLDTLLRRKLPKIIDVMNRFNTNCTAMCSAWFICLYVDILPIETTLRVFDCLLYEGDKILFRVALTLFYTYYKPIIEVQSFPEFAVCFHKIACNNDVLYCHGFMEKCFDKPDSLSYRLIRSLREKCAETIRN